MTFFRTRVSRRTMEDGNDEVSIERVLCKECTAHAAGGQPRTEAINYFRKKQYSSAHVPSFGQTFPRKRCPVYGAVKASRAGG